MPQVIFTRHAQANLRQLHEKYRNSLLDAAWTALNSLAMIYTLIIFLIEK
jgi:hypothetical protein